MDGRRAAQFEFVDPACADIRQQVLQLSGGVVKWLGVGGKLLRGFREQFLAHAHD